VRRAGWADLGALTLGYDDSIRKGRNGEFVQRTGFWASGLRHCESPLGLERAVGEVGSFEFSVMGRGPWTMLVVAGDMASRDGGATVRLVFAVGMVMRVCLARWVAGLARLLCSPAPAYGSGDAFRSGAR